MTLSPAVVRVQRQLFWLRCLRLFHVTQRILAAVLLLLAVACYSRVLPFLWCGILLVTWLVATGWLAWRRKPSDFAALALWGERAGRGEDFAAAWSFSTQELRSQKESEHISEQLKLLPQALRELPRVLPLNWDWRSTLALPVALGIVLLAAAFQPRQAGDEVVAADQLAKVQAEAQRLAAQPLNPEELASLSEEEKAATEALKQSLKDTAAELQDTASARAKDLLSTLEERAREAEQLAQKLQGPDDAWASATLLAALKKQTDTVDLADHLEAKVAAKGAASATRLAEQLSTGSTERRVSLSLTESALKADPTDTTRLAGRRLLDSARSLQSQRTDLAVNELKALASDLLQLAKREEAAKQIESLAQQLRDAAAQATGQGGSSQLAEVQQAQGSGEMNPGGSTQQSLTEQMEQAQQTTPGQDGQPQPQGNRQGQSQPQQVMISKTPMLRGNSPENKAPRDPKKPLLLAPIPGDDSSEQPKETLTFESNDLPPGGKLTNTPGTGLQAGSAKAKLTNAATQQQKATDTKTVTANSSNVGASSTRQIAGAFSEQASTLSTQNVTAEFLAAEEAALDDSTLPIARREQVRRYFMELRKRLEKK